MESHEHSGVVSEEDWYHFRVELSHNGNTSDVGMWVSGEDTVVDAQNVANRRAKSFAGKVNRVKFCHEGYYNEC